MDLCRGLKFSLPQVVQPIEVKASFEKLYCKIERPKTKGRPPKYYHPLLQKEKALSLAVHKILPSAIADAVCIKGSRLAHLYGLPKTHKKQLSVRPILSATSTYNYALAKWLEDKLKPLSYNKYSILDIFEFAEEIRAKGINEDRMIS